jgi:hypothetical protein
MRDDVSLMHEIFLYEASGYGAAPVSTSSSLSVVALTRVVTLQWSTAESTVFHKWLGVKTEHHKLSHDTLQQKKSISHTAWQHAESLHPNVGWETLHAPLPGSPQLAHRLKASLTHRPSHELLQQNESTAHTSLQHAGSLHVGELCVSKQLFVADPPQV